MEILTDFSKISLNFRKNALFCLKNTLFRAKMFPVKRFGEFFTHF